MESIFYSLWKKKDIPEDFRTEILCFVLENLYQRKQLSALCEKLKIPLKKFYNPSITTQITAGSNRFDIFITDIDKIVIFENKWDSKTDINQLIAYDKYLQTSPLPQKVLIHVTKEYTRLTHPFKSNFYKINWSHIYEALIDISDDLVSQEFLNFLELEGIAMKKVSWEIQNGAKSIYSLTRVIQRACEELGLRHSWKPGSADYTAQCIDDRIYIYFLFNDSKLYFCIYDKNKPSEELTVTLWGDDHGVYFNFDEHYFFHKDLEEQIDSIKSFIKKFLSLIVKE